MLDLRIFRRFRTARETKTAVETGRRRSLVLVGFLGGTSEQLND